MKKNISFEEAMLLLEESVKSLEDGSLSLEDALSEYEKAVGLVKLCNEKIENAKRKVQILVEGDGGSVTDMPFADANDET